MRINWKSYFKQVVCLGLSYIFGIFLFSVDIYAQILLKESRSNLYLFESKGISEGEITPYLSIRTSYQWMNQNIFNQDDLLISRIGSTKFRHNRLKFYPTIESIAALNGGHLFTDGGYINISPVVTVNARYKLPPLGRYGLFFWSRFEKHSILSDRVINNIDYDLSTTKEIGYTGRIDGNDSYIEYDIGDGGIEFNYPSGRLIFAKSNSVWGPGYTGQLLLSNKAPSFPFLNIRHRISNNWTFTFLHGSLNSGLRDSTYINSITIAGMQSKPPLIRKYIAAHKLDYTYKDVIRIGFGESVIYGARGIEMAYILAVLPYWSVQHDLSDSDNLQWFADFEVMKKNVGRIYGSFYMDEWDLVNTFDKDKNHNWFAYQAGFSYLLPVIREWGSLFRFEYTKLSPYVYNHKNRINSLTHYETYLGYWSGPNSDNVFFSLEGKPAKNLWVQIYGQKTRRGEVNDSTVTAQYNDEQMDFLSRSYNGVPETKTVYGIMGEYRVSTFIKIELDIFYYNWKQKKATDSDERRSLQKWDAIFKFSIGL